MRSSGSPGSWPPSAAEFRCVSLTLHPHLKTSNSFLEFGAMFMAANRAVLTSHAPARVRIALPRRRAEASAHARSRPACSSRHAARQTRASTRRSRRAVSICSLIGGPAQRAGSPARAASGAFSARVRHCASGPIGLPARHQGSFSSARVARRTLTPPGTVRREAPARSPARAQPAPGSATNHAAFPERVNRNGRTTAVGNIR